MSRLIDFDRLWKDVDAKLAEQGLSYMEGCKMLDMDDPARLGRVVGRPTSIGDLLVWVQWLGKSMRDYAAPDAQTWGLEILDNFDQHDAHQTRDYLRQTQQRAAEKNAIHQAVMASWPHARLASEDN